MQLIINDKDSKALKADKAVAELAKAGYKLPLEIAFVLGQSREIYNPEKQSMEIKEPRGKTIPLIGKYEGATIRVYDFESPDVRNPNIKTFLPTSKAFIKDSAYEIVESVTDEILAWFIVFCSQVCEGNEVRELDRKEPLIRIVNRSAELAESVRNRKLKRRLDNLILVDSESTREEQDRLVLIAKSLNISDVDLLVSEDVGYARLSMLVEGHLGDLKITGDNKEKNVKKIEELLSLVDDEITVVKAAIRQAIDDGKITLQEQDGMQLWYLCDADGQPKELVVADIPVTFDAFDVLIEKIKEPKSDKLVKKIATLLKA
jgi:hypothetical protein